jgi:hypothetical protein
MGDKTLARLVTFFQKVHLWDEASEARKGGDELYPQ